MIVRHTEEFTINIIRGDTYSFCIEICGGISSVDVEAVCLTVKKNPQSSVEVIRKRLGDGVELLSETTDAIGVTRLKYRFTISHADTKDLAVRGYYYDVEVRFTGDEYYTPLRGRFCVDYDISTD